MRKISVASVPPIFELAANGNDEEDGIVYCQGLTAKLHSRFGRIDDEKQVSYILTTTSFRSLLLKSTKGLLVPNRENLWVASSIMVFTDLMVTLQDHMPFETAMNNFKKPNRYFF